ncbi:MAG: YraN family protein [Patescibacteria group bacterium]|jgi:putative endonuclease
MANYRQKLGQWGEDIAREYLVSKGYLIITGHWQKNCGEIDIIAYDRSRKELVFVEVKARSSVRFSRPDETIDQRKMARLEKVIGQYLAENDFTSFRVDAIVIIKSWRPRLYHYKNIYLG